MKEISVEQWKAGIVNQLEMMVSTMDEEYKARYGNKSEKALEGMRVPALLRAYRNLAAGVLKNIKDGK